MGAAERIRASRWGLPGRPLKAHQGFAFCHDRANF
jgi:hypothetical protein